MISPFYKSWILRAAYVALLLCLSACFDDPKGTTGRAKIADTNPQIPKPQTAVCTTSQLVSNEGNQCFQGTCPSNFHLVSNQTERDQVMKFYDEEISPGLSSEEDTKRRQNFFRARDICAAGSAPSRPSNVINIVDDFCVCQNRVSLSTNDCANTCANRSADSNATLVINTNPNATLLNDERFFTDTIRVGTLNSWCNMTINDGRKNPACTVHVFNGTNTFVLNQNIRFEQQNTLSVTIPNGLTDNTTYLAHIVESGSGSNAKSVPFQFRLKRENSTTSTTTASSALKIEPMKMYSCLFRRYTKASENVNSNSYTFSFRLSMFEQLAKAPVPVSNTSQLTIFCHDFQRFGKNDSSSYPRLESFSHIFSLWDKDDSRFTNQGGGLVINSLIHQRLLAEYGLADTTQYFSPFYGGNNGARYHPLIQTSVIQGYILTAFQDHANATAYCPNSSHYNSNEPKFKILKEVIGVETEGLFMGIMTPVTYTSIAPDAPPVTNVDIIYIRESIVNQIWFYSERNNSGLLINKRPTPETAHTKNLKFYWPPNFADPLGQNNNYQKKVWQEEYQILTGEEAQILIESATGSDNDGGIAEVPTSFRPSDRRLGCVPKE
jgi:hypothetical protein